MNGIDISVIMACCNEAEHIGETLKSLLEQEPVPGKAREIIVADGMSNDGTLATLRQWQSRHPEILVLENPGRIVSTGLNAAIEASSGSIILRMDAHTHYAPDYIRRCVEILESSGADNVGGPARTKSKGYLAGAIAAAYHSGFACGGAHFHDESYEGYVDTVPYGCWRRSTFERLGLFDEELVRNQDDEFNLRTTLAGGRILQSPAIVSWYAPRSTLKALFKQYFQYGFWKVVVIRKHRSAASWRHLVPGTFVAASILLPTAASVVWLLGNSPLGRQLALGWMAMMGFYLSLSALAAFLTARKSKWSLLPVLPLVFGIYHFSYGLGFLFSVTRQLVSGTPARSSKLATEHSR